MRKSILLSILTALFLIPQLSQADSHKDVDAIVVTFYADWCGSCKKLDPKIDKVKRDKEIQGKNIQFVTFDLSNDITKAKSRKKAASLDLTGVFEDAYGTGYAAVVNPKSGKVLQVITKRDSIDQIKAMIQKSI